MTVELLGRLSASFWVAVAGAIALYVFFIALAGVSPAEVIVVSVVVGVLAAVFVWRNLRVARDLANHGGDPGMRRSRNHIRERRGF